MSGIIEFLQDNLNPIVRSFVDNPNQVNISVTTSTKTIICQIMAAKQDYGKIIGRKGKTIESLRIITSAMKNTHFPNDLRKISLEILDDEVPSFNYKQND